MNSMSVTGIRGIAFLIIVHLVPSMSPTFALEYKPGVKVGQWIEYGNIEVNGTAFESYTDVEWIKWEVISVTGKEVALGMSTKLKNGTVLEGGDSVLNVETGTVNGTNQAASSIAIIAGNIQFYLSYYKIKVALLVETIIPLYSKNLNIIW